MELEKSIFTGSKAFADLMNSFANVKINSLSYDPDSSNISQAIFFHLFKMKNAAWIMKEKFGRNERYSFSNLFQDIVAFYLKACLPKEFELEIERKIDKIKPDISIKLQGKYVFIIEVKTTIGWNRGSLDVEMDKRIKEISKAFGVPENQIIYVFEEPWNVNKNFAEKYWDIKNEKPKPRPDDKPFSFIYPLFSGTDPSYWKLDELIEFSDQEIAEFAKNGKHIVTRFEEILELIKKLKTTEKYF